MPVTEGRAWRRLVIYLLNALHSTRQIVTTFNLWQNAFQRACNHIAFSFSWTSQTVNHPIRTGPKARSVEKALSETTVAEEFIVTFTFLRR